MHRELLKVAVAALLLAVLIAGSVRRAWHDGGFGPFLQLFGAGCLAVVVFAHLCEALGWFVALGWGKPASSGHYLDLVAAWTGLVCVPAGYLLSTVHRPANRR